MSDGGFWKARVQFHFIEFSRTKHIICSGSLQVIGYIVTRR